MDIAISHLQRDLEELRDCVERLRAACARLSAGELGEREAAVLAVARHHLAELRALVTRLDQQLSPAGASRPPGSCPACQGGWWRYRAEDQPRWECAACGWTAIDPEGAHGGG
ncbi:MAG TPA: hypothetical protein VFD49_15910 [Candidatus Dormibacteraeota bacterium]|nr:hypothetical protein [Candidatus Dormibacteraeota bacterium]